MSAPASAPPWLNRTALFSVAWLLCLVAAFYGVKAVQTRVPQQSEVRTDVLTVEAAALLVLERNNQAIGHALFLSDAKPAPLQRSGALLLSETKAAPREHSRYSEDDTTVLFHDDLGLTSAELNKLHALVPARLDVLTLDGLAIGVSHNGREIHSLAHFQERAQHARTVRWTVVGAALLAALGAALWGFRLPREPAKADQAPVDTAPAQP